MIPPVRNRSGLLRRRPSERAAHTQNQQSRGERTPRQIQQARAEPSGAVAEESERVGPRNPPRVPNALMSPMLAAAAARPRNTFGRRRQQEHVWIAESVPDRNVSLLGRPFPISLGGQPVPFFRPQPLGLLRPLGEIEQRRHTERHRRQPFQNQEPAPTAVAEPVHSQEQRRQRPAQNLRRWNPRKEHGDSSA